MLTAAFSASAQAAPDAQSVPTELKTRLLQQATTYVTERNSHLLTREAAAASDRRALSTRAREVAKATDAFLDGKRLHLKGLRQQWNRSTQKVDVASWERDGSAVVLKAREHTTLYFDRSLDRKLPEATEQIVTRTFRFEPTGGAWVLDRVTNDDGSPLGAINDLPSKTVQSAGLEAGGSGIAPDQMYEYEYGTPYQLSPAEVQQDSEPDVALEPAPASAPDDGMVLPDDKESAALAGGYCYTCMRDYALKYALSYNTSYRRWSQDCTNFISQTMRAGGWGFDYGWYRSGWNWWYNSLNQTWTWAGAENWSQFADNSNRAYVLSSVWSMGLGDVLQYDSNRDYSMDHTMVVTYKSTSAILLSYHTTDTKNRSLSDILYGRSSYWWYAWRT